MYSHLLDSPSSIEANEHTRKLKEMMDKYKDRCAHVLRGNKSADTLAAESNLKKMQYLPVTSVNDPDYVVYTRNTTTNKRQRLGERKYAKVHLR